jgi:hypothetical protein
VRRWLDAINKADVEVTDDVFSPDSVRRLIYHASVTRVGRGPEAIKRRIAEWLVAYPDWQFTVEDMLAEGDVVMTRCTVRGTPSGEPFNKPEMRRALSYALDRDQIRNTVYFGAGKTLQLPVPEVIPWAYLSESLPYGTQDLTRAKQELQKAGLSNPTFSIQIQVGPEFRIVAEPTYVADDCD